MTLKRIYFVIVCFFQYIQANIGTSFFLRNDQFSDVNVSDDHVWAFTEQYWIDCVIICKDRDICRSLSYNMLNKQCQGFNVDFRDLTVIGSSDPGWIHYDKNCAMGWERFKSHCYLFVANKTTWQGAVDACAKANSDLVIIESLEENEWIKRVVVDKGLVYPWIGANDIDSDGIWIWVDGTPLSFTLWGLIEPSGDGKCVNVMNGNWNDRGCHLNNVHFICKTKL